MEPIDFSPEDLIDLVERLRLASFKIGVGQHITAQNALAALAARGQAGSVPGDVGAWLAPILCTSPEEQATFHKLFEDWSQERWSAEPTHSRPRRAMLRNAWLWASVVIIAVAVFASVRRSGTRGVSGLPTPKPTPIVVTPADRVAPAWPLALVIGLSALLAGGWWLWKVPRASQLVRWRDEDDLPLERLRVRGVAEHLFGGLHALRRYRSAPTGALDVNSTVDATVRNAGCFTPVYGFRKATPEFLLIIDRTGFGDQQAALGEALYGLLQKTGVSVARYFFQSEPKHFRGDDPTAAHLTLEELTALHPEHDLIIFGDGEGLLDPLTGRPARWLGKYPRRSTPVLLTPMPQRLWGYRERELAQEGLLVVHADRSGVSRLTETFSAGESTEREHTGWRPRYPEALRQRPERWLTDEPATTDALKRLRFQLRLFLGAEGYQWLCACAVYPVLLWDLTLYLGRALTRALGFEENLSKLVQLPWFRHGVMPDWLRLQLVSDLEPEQEREVRQALSDLLLSCAEGDCAPLELEILLRRQGTQPSRGRGGQILSDYLKAHPESRLRDYVLLTFMSGLKPDPLAVDVPAEVFNRLQPLDGPKWPIYLIDGALLGMAYFTLLVTTLFPTAAGLALGLTTVLCSLVLVFQLHEWSFDDVIRALPSMVPRFRRVKAERHAERHPKGLYVLLAAGAWERFGYYSMRAVFFLYLTNIGEGKAWSTAYASNLYWLFSFGAYVTLIPGGWLGDRKFGRWRVVMAGGLLLLAGYLLLTQGSSPALYAALLCITTGGGLYKPNIIAMVGDLYSEGSLVKDRAYTLFYLSVYVGALVGPLATGYVSQNFGFGLAFAVSAGGMLISVLVLFFFKRLVGGEGWARQWDGAAQVDDARSARIYAPQNFNQETSAPGGIQRSRVIFALAATFFLAVIYWACLEVGNTPNESFARKHTSWSWNVPAGFLLSLNAIFIIIVTLPLVRFWRELAKRGRELSTPAKMAAGLALTACSFYVMALAGKMGGDEGQVSPAWTLCALFFASLGEIMVAPLIMSLVSNSAPRHVRGLIMGVFLSAVMLGSWLSSSILPLYGNLDSEVYSNLFILLGTIGLVTAAALSFLVKYIKRAMTDDEADVKPATEIFVIDR